MTLGLGGRAVSHPTSPVEDISFGYPFSGRDEMRRGVEPGLEVVPSKDRLTKGAGRAFSFSAADVNDRDGVLAIFH